MKTLLKSVHIYQRYCKKNLAQFFFGPSCILYITSRTRVGTDSYFQFGVRVLGNLVIVDKRQDLEREGSDLEGMSVFIPRRQTAGHQVRVTNRLHLNHCHVQTTGPPY